MHNYLKTNAGKQQLAGGNSNPSGNGIKQHQVRRRNLHGLEAGPIAAQVEQQLKPQIKLNNFMSGAHSSQLLNKSSEV